MNNPGQTMTVLRLQLWLKLVLSWRGYRSNKLKVLSIVIFVFMLVPITIVAVGLHYMLQTSAPGLRDAIARDGLTVVYMIWILAPLLGFQLNESYDVTKLFAFPVSYGQIFLGSVIGSLIDPPVLLVMLPMASLWISFSADAGAMLANGLLIFLFLLQTISTAQAITIVLIGFLRSRRFRDMTMVIFPILGVAYYVGQQAIVHQFFHLGNSSFFNAPVWSLANWLPPGFAARGLSSVASQGWGEALLCAMALIAFTAVAMTVAALALKRLYLGDATAIGSGPVRQRAQPSANGIAAPAWLPADIATIAVKELVYLRRDPQYKAILVQMIYTFAVIAVPVLMPGYGRNPMTMGPGFWQDIPLFGVAAALVLATSPLIFNLFGGEGTAVTVLFSFPTPRRKILMAKNLAHALTLLVVNLIGLILAAGVTGRWSALPVVVGTMTIALPILLAAGNLISIRLPHRMLIRGQRWQRGGMAAAGSGGNGWAYAFLYSLAYLVTLAAIVPVIAAVVLPTFAASPAVWYIVSLPLAVAYSAVLYIILLGVAEGWLMSREPEIAAVVVPPD